MFHLTNLSSDLSFCNCLIKKKYPMDYFCSSYYTLGRVVCLYLWSNWGFFWSYLVYLAFSVMYQSVFLLFFPLANPPSAHMHGKGEKLPHVFLFSQQASRRCFMIPYSSVIGKPQICATTYTYLNLFLI